MNVLKTMIFSFLLISGFSHAAPEIINANAVIYKTVEDITLKLHVYNPKKFDEQKIHNAIIFFHGGGWNNGNHKAFKRQSMYFASRGIYVDSRLMNVLSFSSGLSTRATVYKFESPYFDNSNLSLSVSR